VRKSPEVTRELYRLAAYVGQEKKSLATLTVRENIEVAAFGES